MLMDYRYSAIVLKKREVGETDRLYTFYTREQGKITSLAKGVRKSEAKLASALETLSLIDLMVVRTHGSGKVAGAMLEKSFPTLRQGYRDSVSVFEAVALFEQLIEPEEADPVLFHLLADFLETADTLAGKSTSDKIVLLAEAFLFQVFAHLGYQLVLDRCAATGEKLAVGQPHYMSAMAGGVLSVHGSEAFSDALGISENCIKLLRLFTREPLARLVKLTVPEHDLALLCRFRKEFFRWIRR